MNIGRIIGVLFLLGIFGNYMTNVHAGSFTQIEQAMCDLYNTINNVVNIVIIMMIILAAITYAGGQALGAETRARATVWATTMAVGAIIGVGIKVLLPVMMNTIAPMPEGGGDWSNPTFCSTD
ncbi:hypothetical protein KAW38_04715 [Candidatus Micrarchaeota archaeon]|nr:hypothetical protein [Candidatus Micrarchaeota archaeon]